MLFDYLFFVASILNWLLLGLVIFGGKAVFSLNPTEEKNLFKKSFPKVALFILLLIVLLKIATLVWSGIALNHLIVSLSLSRTFLIFALYQLLAIFILLFLSMLLSVRFGFKEDIQNRWVDKIARFFVLFLFFDFFAGLFAYHWFIYQLFSQNLKSGSLFVASPVLTATQWWLALGLGLSLIVYFIFYVTLKRRNSAVTVAGISVSYLIILVFSLLLLYAQFPFLAPDLRYLLNDSLLYLSVLWGGIVLLLGIGSVLFMVLIYNKRTMLKNEFYFDYLLMRLGSFHAVCVAGLALIAFTPTLFLLWYR